MPADGAAVHDEPRGPAALPRKTPRVHRRGPAQAPGELSARLRLHPAGRHRQDVRMPGMPQGHRPLHARPDGRARRKLQRRRRGAAARVHQLDCRRGGEEIPRCARPHVRLRLHRDPAAPRHDQAVSECHDLVVRPLRQLRTPPSAHVRPVQLQAGRYPGGVAGPRAAGAGVGLHALRQFVLRRLPGVLPRRDQRRREVLRGARPRRPLHGVGAQGRDAAAVLRAELLSDVAAVH